MGHSLLTSKLYTPAAHLRYFFRVSEYQPSANIPIRSDISKVFEVNDISTCLMDISVLKSRVQRGL